MTRKKSNEFLNALAITAVCIGLFSAVFLGFNNRAIAAATSGTESIAIAAATVNLPAADADDSADEYAYDYAPQSVYTAEIQPPTLTVLVHANTQQNPPGANAMSPEEAAQIGARYLYDVLGQCIDGMYVMMEYFASPSIVRPYWFGMVAGTVSELENYTPQLGFTICAVSGERITVRSSAIPTARPAGEYITTSHLMYHMGQLWPSALEDNPEWAAEIPAAFAAAIEGRCFNELWEELMSGLMPSVDEIQRYLQLAREYAARHFACTEVVSAEFDMARHSGFFTLDSEGNLTANLAQPIITVTDCTGRAARVILAVGDDGVLLQAICTQHNDIIPGHGDLRM